MDTFNIPVNCVRKGDTIILYNGERLLVVDSGKNFSQDRKAAWVISTVKPESQWDYFTYPHYGMQDEDGPEPYWPLDMLETHLFDSGDEWIRVQTNKVEQLFIDDVGNVRPIRWWVAIYEMDMGYGGPEEGGWWYDIGTVQSVFAAKSREDAYALRERLESMVESTGDYSSVLYSGGDYRVRVCSDYPQNYPETTPYYS